jgi:bla regulator protein BlaR1
MWFIGGSGILVSTAFIHWQLCRRLKQIAVCDDSRLRELWKECRNLAGGRTNTPILLFDGIQQPTLLGLFYPKLLLPPDTADLNDEQLRMIMLHELAHLRHWDIAANWVLFFIRTIHWWNPFYWLAASRFQSLREQACDAFAIRRIEGKPTGRYSDLLLTLAQRGQSQSAWRVMLPASSLGFFPSLARKRAIQNRLRALRVACVTQGRIYAAAVAVLVGLLAFAGLTDATAPNMATVRPSDPVFAPLAHEVHDGSDWAPPQVDPGPRVVRTYDIEKALDRIAADESSKDVACLKLKALFTRILRGSTGGYDSLTDEWAQEQFTLDGATLNVNAPLHVHTEIARNISAWEQSGLSQICIKTRLLSDDRDLASAIGISWQFLEAFSDDYAKNVPSENRVGMPVIRAQASVEDYFPIAVTTLDEHQLSALLQAAQKHRTASVISAPKLTIFNGQQALLCDCAKTPYVVGIHYDNEGIRQPKIAVIASGIKVTMRATQVGSAKKVHLEARLELSGVPQVRTASALLRGAPTTIQIPSIEKRCIDISSDVDEGQSLLIGCIPTSEEKKFSAVIVGVPKIWTGQDIN